MLKNDRRGVVYLETLIAFLPVFAFFLGTLQLADLSVAHLIVQHASSTAARAAVVVLPDDGAWYGDRDNAEVNAFKGARRVDIERSADLILRALPRLKKDSINVNVTAAGFAERNDLLATVEARYRCLIPALCGSGLDLKAETKLVYQGARYVYESQTQMLDNAIDKARDVAKKQMDNPGDPKAGEVEGKPLFADADPKTQNPQDPNNQNPDYSGNPDNSQNPDNNQKPKDPSQPKDPTKPDPKQPKDPGADPTKPDPSDTNKPPTNKPPETQPTKPSDDEKVAQKPPTKPGANDPTKPADPSKPDQPTGPIATKPNDPIKPGANDPTKPAPNDPSKPGVDLTKPGQPTGPVATKPSDPSKPTDPTKPGVDLTKPGAKPPVDVTKPGLIGPIAGVMPPVPSGPACTGPACGRPGGACFVAGTLVSTPSGPKPIESVQSGDRVYAYDETARAPVVAQVSAAFVRPSATLVDLVIRELRDGHESIVSATPEHPFYVPAAQQYVPAGALPVGAVLLSLNGSSAEVIAASAREGRFTVFNFTVEGQHNYFVAAPASSSDGVLVHNKDGCDGASQAKAKGLPTAPEHYHWRYNPNGDMPIPVRNGSAPDDVKYWFDYDKNEWVEGEPPPPPPPPSDDDLPPADRDLDKELNAFRGRLGVPRGIPGGGTAAVGRADVPGLESTVFEGASRAPRNVNPSPHTPHLRNTTKLPKDEYDAEVDLANHFIDSVNAAGLNANNVQGTLNIRVEQSVCSTCRAGLDGKGKGPGALRQLSLEYPNLTIRVTARGTGEVIYIRGGVRIPPPKT